MVFEKLKQRWGVTSTWRFVAIMIVFSLAGMAVVQIRLPLFRRVDKRFL